MVYNNKINSKIDQYGVVIGGSNGQMKTANPSDNTSLFVSHGPGIDPGFANNLNSDFTLSTTFPSFSIQNTSNTLNSDANKVVSVTGNLAGDSAVIYKQGASNTIQGIDASDSHKFKISNSNVLGTSDVIVVTSDGEITMPQQPCFLACLSNDVLNATGNNTAYTIIFDTVIFNQNTGYNNLNGIYTLPVTGKYMITMSIKVKNIAANMTSLSLYQQYTSPLTSYGYHTINPSKVRNASNEYSFNFSYIFNVASLNQSFRAPVITISGSTKTATIAGSATDMVTYMAARLIG